MAPLMAADDVSRKHKVISITQHGVTTTTHRQTNKTAQNLQVYLRPAMADDNQHLPQVQGLKVKGTFLHLLPFDKLAAMIDDKLWKIDLPSKDQPAFAYIRKDPVRLSAQPKSPEDSPISSPLVGPCYC